MLVREGIATHAVIDATVATTGGSKNLNRSEVSKITRVRLGCDRIAGISEALAALDRSLYPQRC
jgi:hypothetical protein